MDVESVLRDYMWWCESRVADARFRDVDRADVVSAAMQALWEAVGWCEKKGINEVSLLRVASRFLMRGIYDIRREQYRAKRMPRDGHIVQWPVYPTTGEEIDFPDICAEDPLVALIREEEYEKNAEDVRRHSSPPCPACGTELGLVPKGCLRPTRVRGLCKSCYTCSQRERRRGRLATA